MHRKVRTEKVSQQIDLPQVILFLCAKRVTNRRRSWTGLPQKRTLKKSSQQTRHTQQGNHGKGLGALKPFN